MNLSQGLRFVVCNSTAPNGPMQALFIDTWASRRPSFQTWGSGQDLCSEIFSKKNLLGTPNREPQDYSRNMVGIYLRGPYIPFYSSIFLRFPVWGSH